MGGESGDSWEFKSIQQHTPDSTAFWNNIYHNKFFLVLDLVPDRNVSYFITVLVHGCHETCGLNGDTETGIYPLSAVTIYLKIIII